MTILRRPLCVVLAISLQTQDCVFAVSPSNFPLRQMPNLCHEWSRFLLNLLVH